MYQRHELLRRRLARQQSNPAAVAHAKRGRDLLRNLQRDVLLSKESNQPVPVPADFARDGVFQFRQVRAFGLADVLSRDLRPRFYPLDRARELVYFPDGSRRKWLLC